MTNNQLTDEQIAQLLGDACMVIGDRFATVDELSAAKAIRALAVELQERRKPLKDKDLQGVIDALEHPAGINAAGKQVVRLSLVELQERRKADSEPVGWTDEEELRDVEKSGCGYLFKANPITPHADPRRVILLYRHAQPAQTGVDDDVRNIIGLLEINEWADHCTETVLGSRLESEITRLYNWRAAQPAPDDYQHLRELYHAQEKRLFKIAQRIKGPTFDKYSHSPSQAIDVLEAAIFGENQDSCRAAMLQAAPVRSSMPDGGVTAEHRRVIEMLLNVCGAAFELADDSCQQDVDGEDCHVVPDDAFQKLSDALDEIENTLPTEDIDRPDVFLAWSAMPRAALKSILQAGNSPVIPAGYVMVPKEPTERMIIDGFESEPDETFSEPRVWEKYQKMSGCQQAAYRARLCYAAMISAAPKQENI